MGAALERGRLLYQQERYDLALKEFAQAISEEPEDGEPKALMALTLSNLKREKEAIAMAQRAIATEPDDPYPHYALAAIYTDGGKTKLAEASAREAIRLYPEEAEYHTLLALIFARQTRWKAALESANTALYYDADHVGANALRGQALTMLGKKDEARTAAHKAIAEEPENAYAHRSAGYVYLTQGQHIEALKHFKEALRLNPDDDASREGLLDALRSRYAPYRWMIAVGVFLQRFPENVRWILIIGAFVLTRALRSIGKENPALMPYVLPIVIAYSAFVWFTWIGEPLINVLLLLHPIGRYALSRQERLESYWIVALLASSVLMLLLAIPFKSTVAWAAIGPAITIVIVSLFTHLNGAPKVRAVLTHGIGAAGMIISWVIAAEFLRR